jgi:ABC-type uncharacterized transport system substrate-binding protein
VRRNVAVCTLNRNSRKAAAAHKLVKTLISLFRRIDPASRANHSVGDKSDFMRKLALGLIGLSLFAGAPAALAHPHVWIEMHSDVVVNGQGHVTGINIEWTFDDAYAQMAIDGLDANKDGVYSSAELAPLTKENLASLKDYDYFTHAKVNGQPAALGTPTDFGQIYSNDKLKLYFTVPLAKPVDPRKGEFYYRIYDPEFFISMDYVKDDPVSVIGNLPEGCKLDVKPIVADAQLEDTRQMLSTKGKDWQPPPEEEFGAMFAQPVHIACGA